MNNYYNILGISKDASKEEIKKAYRALAKKTHPDVGGSEDEFHKIDRAYKTLIDEEKRKKYDARLGATKKKKALKPKPVVTPSIINFGTVEPSQEKEAYFVLKNEGGPYSRVQVEDPNSWVKVVEYEPLGEGKLPTKITIRVKATMWDSKYSEAIKVYLDDQEAYVQIYLQTREKPKFETTKQYKQKTSKKRTTKSKKRSSWQSKQRTKKKTVNQRQGGNKKKKSQKEKSFSKSEGSGVFTFIVIYFAVSLANIGIFSFLFKLFCDGVSIISIAEASSMAIGSLMGLFILTIKLAPAAIVGFLAGLFISIVGDIRGVDEYVNTIVAVCFSLSFMTGASFIGILRLLGKDYKKGFVKLILLIGTPIVFLLTDVIINLIA